MAKDINKNKIDYLLRLLGKSHLMEEDFEDFHQIYYTILRTMTRKAPIQMDVYESETTRAQQKVEEAIRSIYLDVEIDLMTVTTTNCGGSKASTDVIFPPLDVAKHENYCRMCLSSPLPGAFIGLDGNQCWMMYWLSNGHGMLKGVEGLPADISEGISAKISLFVIDEGRNGISSGPFQKGHVASVYAAVLALIAIGDFKTLTNARKGLYDFFYKMKQKDGSFSMTVNGESDARSTYCVVVLSYLLNILDDKLVDHKTLQWLDLCQTYEGGFGGVPNTEAHGGYTYCALAAYYVLLGKEGSTPKEFLTSLRAHIDVDKLLSWLVHRQHLLEGSFDGRTNKLVDACYSFWVGACFAMLEATLEITTLFNRESLKLYMIHCAQGIEMGGFRDKPGKQADFYHTNYSLCGVSVLEHYFTLERNGSWANSFTTEIVDDTNVNTNPVNPIFGLPILQVSACVKYFSANV
ncbi:CAAX farnesyltransferase (FTase) subunit beta [Scheffersomyces spartinae]|uniref:Protein farnesyltransferase subunit beta n=1 Tax=Scheffersomyces spartinae TaxID=45513 RepID=A0A9P7V5Y1_9ASCO|nr:CAAX farnesyltransferase (FTase) subunit beta [Scheffersomyces spartinae]KAG7191977.1 CAAX farnesyltransferase (FTase) subunit beta [Scheffersomyces spartinae]